MGEILIKTCFSTQSEPHTDKLCFSVVLKHFWRNSQVTSLFSQKKGLCQKGTLNYSENLIYLTCLKRDKSWGKIGFVLINVFDQTSKLEEILTKTCFSTQS